MIVRCLKFVASRPSTGAYYFGRDFRPAERNQITPAEVRNDLIEVLEKMEINPRKTIFLEEWPYEEEASSVAKRRKYQHKILNAEQKRQLGLLIPAPAFPARMTKKAELQYRAQVCEQLYGLQQQRLPTSVRVLQLQATEYNIDEYVNSLYKDIFARYMVARGLGVEWAAHHSDYGVMNPAQQHKENPAIEARQFYRWLADLMGEYRVGRKELLGLYSYRRGCFEVSKDFEVENVYKIGYFFAMPLTRFGKYQKQFEVLSERGQKIEALVLVEDITKLLNIESICIQTSKKMVLLSRYQPAQSPQADDPMQAQLQSYLLTSMDVYTDHRQYFNKAGYTKHTFFDAEKAVGMEVAQGIRIRPEIEGYERKGGLYIVDRFSGLGDYERAKSYELSAVRASYITEDGAIRSEYLKDSEEKLYIYDPAHSQKILEKAVGNIPHVRKLELYSTYQDQIYSMEGEKLHFKVGHRYVIPIPEENHSQLEACIGQSILSESKVEVPSMNRYYPKPRDRRRHRKQIRMLEEQETEYMTLKDSLDSIRDLALSSMTRERARFALPLVLRKWSQDGVEQEEVVRGEIVRRIVDSSLNIVEEGKDVVKLDWDMGKIKDIVHKMSQQLNSEQKDKDKQQHYQIKMVDLSNNLFKGFQCFKNYDSTSDISNVVIEPQSKTEDVVPFFFHLHFMVHKMLLKNKHTKQGGRRTRNTKLQQAYTNRLFSLIKFHPTLDAAQKTKQVDEILFGIVKANDQQQYGYGLEALRLWVARNDSYLGDRRLVDRDVNKQLQLSAFIRKLYWQILPLMGINLDTVFMEDPNNQIEVQLVTQGEVPREQLTYLHRFMLDHINYYILNMEECYKKMDLTRALRLTEDFFKNYVEQIFVKAVRKRLIAYPLHPQTKQHLYILRKVLELAGVLSPLLPFSMYHVSKVALLQWPALEVEQVRPELIVNYNRMTKLRVELRNKLIVNGFYHSELVIPREQLQDSDIWRLSREDMELFFDIENISLQEPVQLGKSFKLKLTPGHPLGELEHIRLYEYKQVCIRCSPTRNYGKHLCPKCLEYLNNNFGKRLPLNS